MLEIVDKCGPGVINFTASFFYLHYSIYSDITYTEKMGTGVMLPMKIINFAHPLTNEQLQEIKALTKTEITAILDINSQISAEKPLAPQIEKMLDSTGLSSQEWQTSTLLINLPSLNYSAAALLAQLHGRIGYFPPVLRLHPLTEKIPFRYAVTEILNLQAIREHARKKR